MSESVRNKLLKQYKASWSSGPGTTLQSGSVELLENEWFNMFKEALIPQLDPNRSREGAFDYYWTKPKMWKSVICKEVEKYLKANAGRKIKSLRFSWKDSRFPNNVGMIEVHYFAYRQGRGRPADIEKAAVNLVKAGTRVAMKKVTAKVKELDKRLAEDSYFNVTEGDRMSGFGRSQTSKTGAKRKTYKYSEYSHGAELPSDHTDLEAMRGRGSRAQNLSNLRKEVQTPGKSGVASGAQGVKAVTNIGKALLKNCDSDLLYSSGLANVLENWIEVTFGYKLDLKKGRTAQSIKDEIRLQGILMPPNDPKNPDLWDSVLKQSFEQFIDKKGTFTDFVVNRMGKSPEEAEKIFSDSSGPGEWLKQNAPRIVAQEFQHLTKMGTPDMRFKANKELFKKVKQDKKSGRTDTTKKPVKTRRVKGKKKRYPIGATAAVAKRTKRPASGVPQGQNVMALKELLNKLLPPQVLKNMGLPRLVNRTGRFKDSAEITNIVMGPRGGMVIDYTYQRYPYEVFEPGNRLGNQYRDPRHVIGLSIREIVAMQMKGANPILRRV